MKDAYWFRHDANARHDDKCYALIRKYGMAGYGMFWIIIERMREATNYKLLDDEITLNGLSAELGISVSELSEFIDDCILLFKLFVRDGDNYIYSRRLLEEMSLKETISSKNRKNAKERWNKARDKKEQEQRREAGQLYFSDIEIGKSFFVLDVEYQKLTESTAQNIETREVMVFKNKLVKVTHELNN